MFVGDRVFGFVLELVLVWFGIGNGARRGLFDLGLVKDLGSYGFDCFCAICVELRCKVYSPGIIHREQTMTSISSTSAVSSIH